MGSKILNFIFSTQLMLVLLVLFPIAMGLGTFLESWYSTDAARIWVYNAWWFEALMLLLMVNFMGNIKKYNLLSREKLSVLILHLSFIFILLGAFVTRYIGDDKQWSTDIEILSNWINGKTNEPFVNANMIELLETGFMSNRGRQNVANYLTKELKIDWRIGAEYFESMLIDYDVHSNYGNWLYNAGIGNDSMPFRKFNPKLQSERYDPDKLYEKIWLND